MKILLLGATGRTGKYVLQKALKDGFEVNCVVRNGKKIHNQKGLTVFEGNPNNLRDLENAIMGCDAIVSVLNISRTSDFPWAKLRTPENYLSEVMKKLVPLAEKNNIKRITVCSAWGVADSKKEIPNWFRWFIDHSNIGVAYQDHEKQEDIISNSKLNWTIVRPVGLTNTARDQGIRESIDMIPKPSLTISRMSLAKYLVDSLNNDNLIRKKVVISKN